jgi:hypothetical protein
MPIYPGEHIQVAGSAKQFDGKTPLSDRDVTSVTINIFDSDGTEVLVETAMSYDSDSTPRWTYIWDTTGIDSGTYRARIKFTGVTFVSFEYHSISISEDPVS